MMKRLVLTGLAHEMNIEDPGDVMYLLVFNGGELRIPVLAESAKEVLRYTAEKTNGHNEQQEVVTAPHDPDPELDEDEQEEYQEDLLDQQVRNSLTNMNLFSEHVDEDGIPQV